MSRQYPSIRPTTELTRLVTKLSGPQHILPVSRGWDRLHALCDKYLEAKLPIYRQDLSSRKREKKHWFRFPPGKYPHLYTLLNESDDATRNDRFCNLCATIGDQLWWEQLDNTADAKFIIDQWHEQRNSPLPETPWPETESHPQPTASGVEEEGSTPAEENPPASDKQTFGQNSKGIDFDEIDEYELF